jgi:hypothetical protein
MIVRYGKEDRKRTCASVRSSLSAQAWRVTAGSEAAETTDLRPEGRGERPRGRCRGCQHQAARGLGWVVCLIQVNCRQAPSKSVELKMLNGSGQNGNAVRLPRLFSRGTRISNTAGVLAGTNPLVSSMGNTVNPMSRSIRGAGALARDAGGTAGRGSWRKRRPLYNGVDRRGVVTLPRKRAHFQPVVRDDRDCRTASGGDRK